MIRLVQVLEATAGGTRKYLRELVESLDAREFDVRIVCAMRRDPTFADDCELFRANGHRVIELPMSRAPRPLLDSLGCLRLRRILKDEPCDVLHLHSSKAGWLGRMAARGLDCRVVYTPHCFPFLQRVRWPLAALYELAERLSASRTDMLLAVGAAEGRVALARGLYDESRVRVIPNAVRFPEQTARVAEPASVPVVGFIGELRPQKDPLTFLEAARILDGRGAELKFLLPARGALLERVRRFVRRHELESVELVPVGDSLQDFIGRLDIGVAPSRWEGLPYSLLEALGAGVPVVGADIEPLRDVLERIDGALLFPAESARDLADRVEALVARDPADLRQLADTGRELVRREHSLDAWRSAMLAVYRELAGRTRD